MKNLKIKDQNRKKHQRYLSLSLHSHHGLSITILAKDNRFGNMLLAQEVAALVALGCALLVDLPVAQTTASPLLGFDSRGSGSSCRSFLHRQPHVP